MQDLAVQIGNESLGILPCGKLHLDLDGRLVFTQSDFLSSFL